MENFITGYPGHEHQARAAIKKAVGQEKYDFFFDKFLEYFFGEDDAKFFASLGLNCIRLPVNYRHFEDDMNPRVFKKEGLKHLDRVIDIHYKDNTWVAGYNPLNEPTDAEHTRLLEFYTRVEKAIRAIDPDHILFLDGKYGFPNPPAEFTGSEEQVAHHERSFNRKVEYMKQIKNAEDGLPDWQEINERRYNVLECQLDIYAKSKASWSIWLYKDIGFQGMVYVGEDTPYIKLLKPFLDKKKTWKPATHIGRIVRNILLSEELCHEFGQYFEGLSMEQLDDLAKSFSFSSCKQRTKLNEILTKDSKRA
ncbi:hypothetical protein IAU60_005882 [Kwoniella sp. DSM 27419]